MNNVQVEEKNMGVVQCLSISSMEFVKNAYRGTR
uniref:Uncharacterized protein n=1 Tax=Anguilla anguilla TaxID=7936 RepID=A0A0E9SIP5_ANGAN